MLFKRERMLSHALATDPQVPQNDPTPNSVGQTLKRIRVEQGHSFEDVSKSTKIRPYFLTLLEADDFDALPDAVFTTGFIRNFCDYLQIPAEPLIAQYIAQSSAKEAETPFKLYLPQSSEQTIAPRFLIISLIIVGLTSIVWYANETYNIGTLTEIVHVNTLTQDKTNSNQSTPQPSQQKEEKIESSPPLTESKAEVSENKKIIASGELLPNTKISVQPSSLSDSKPIHPQSEFYIKAIEETWIKITNDKDVRLKVLFLKKGEMFSLTPYHENLISVGNSENVEFMQGAIRIKGSDYLETPSGFAESKKIIAPQTSNVIESVASDTQTSAPVL